MKFNKTEIRDRVLGLRKLKALILAVFLLLSFIPSYSKEDNLALKSPIQDEQLDENIPSQIDLNIIPNFPKFAFSTDGRRISANNTIIPLNTSLKLVVDSFIDAKTAKIGDYFKGHIAEDFYISTEIPQLILPKNSWVRGRVISLKRPNFFNKTAKIGIQLDQIVTPLGDNLVLDVELDVQRGVIAANGLLMPQTKQENPQVLPDSTIVVPVIDLGPSLIGKLLAGRLFALSSQVDTVTLNKGQELQIVLQKNIQLTTN